MTTYTALRYKDNLYLVREPVLERPIRRMPGQNYFMDDATYELTFEDLVWDYHAQFQVLVPKEHEHLFEGRTGMVEGKDFEKRNRYGRPPGGFVAIPKEPGAGEEERIIDLWMDVLNIVMDNATPTEEGKIVVNLKTPMILHESFTITRKNP